MEPRVSRGLCRNGNFARLFGEELRPTKTSFVGTPAALELPVLPRRIEIRLGPGFGSALLFIRIIARKARYIRQRIPEQEKWAPLCLRARGF
jgi:hypothetical protein